MILLSSEINTHKIDFSRIIQVLRFPLALLVIFLHNNPLGIQTALSDNDLILYNQFTGYYTFQHLVSNNLTRIAVPLFFFFSGWLFFKKLKTLSSIHSQKKNVTTYVFSKIKKNVFTILVPYIIWNLIFVLMNFTVQELFADSIELHQKFYSNYSLRDWISLIYYPAGGHLWFLRDLFIVSLCSLPLYYLLSKFRRGLLFVIILTIIYIFIPSNILGVISVDSFYFWILGAFLCLSDSRFLYRQRLQLFTSILYILLLIVEIVLWRSNNDRFIYVERLGICVGAYALILLTYRLLLKSNYIDTSLTTSLSKSSFFIYLSHIIVLILVTRLYKSYVPITEISLFLEYCIIPPLTAMILFLVYKFMQKNLPTLMAVLNGGRR